MPSAERLSSKFPSFPRSFASRPAFHFSDNLSALGTILQNSSKPERVFFVLKPSEYFLKANARRSFLHILRIVFLCTELSSIVLKPSEYFLKANARRSFLLILRIFSCFFVLNCQPAFRFSVTSFCKTYSFVFHARFFALINKIADDRFQIRRRISNDNHRLILITWSVLSNESPKK